VKRTALGTAALLLAAGAAHAYIPSLSTLFRRAATKSDDVDRSRNVTLKGMLELEGKPAVAASLILRFPLRCRLQTEAATGKGETPGALSVHGGPGATKVESEGTSLAGATELLQLACPLLTYKAGGKGAGEKTLHGVLTAAGAADQPTTLSRLEDRVVYVIGAQARQLDVPQLWLYKDEMAPARLLSKHGGGLTDLRLLEYGNSAAASAFPRSIELWKDGKLAARFEALEAGGKRAKSSAEEDDHD